MLKVDLNAASSPALVHPGRRRAALGFVLATALMDMIALGIVIPVLPHLIQDMAGGSTVKAAGYLGVFGTVWSLMQFIWSPIIGTLSDRYGRRPVLLLSIFGLGLNYVIMALAPNLAWLFVGRLISGITSASFSTAGAYIADVSPPEKRAQNFGLIGTAFGVGFIIGPSLGGLLGQYGPRLPFWVAAGLALCNGVYGLFILPESLPPERRSAFTWAKANPLGSLHLLQSYRGLLGLAAIFFLAMLAQQALQSILVLYTSYRYHWSIRDMGLYLGAIGLGSILVQTFLVRPVVARLGERGAMLTGLACGGAGFVVYAAAPSGALFWTGLPFFSLMGLMQPGYQAMLSRRVAADEQGRLQGANAGIMSLAGLFGPGLFTAVFAWSVAGSGGQHAPGLALYMSAGLLFAALALALRFANEPSIPS